MERFVFAKKIIKKSMKNIKLWTCPNCSRQFQRQNQNHSCKIFPLEKHFEGKAGGEILHEYLKHKLEKTIGIFKIQSLECCIHFDNNSTFAAVKIFTNKIQVEFSLKHEIANKRFKKITNLSANQFLHYIDITTDKDVDKELIKWLTEAHANKEKNYKILK